MQPRQNHFINVSTFPCRRFRYGNPRVLSLQRSFTGLRNANDGTVELCRYTKDWPTGTCIGTRNVRNRHRAFVTTTSISNDKFEDTETLKGTTLEGQTHSALPNPVQINTASKSENFLRTRRREPIPSQSLVTLSQNVGGILQDVKIGKLSDADINSVLTEVFERCKIQKKGATTVMANIAYAEKLVHRIVQEVNYLHLECIDVNRNKNHESTTNDTSHIFRSLGTMWHYIILGSSYLPVTVDRRQSASNHGKSDSSNALIELPYMATGRLLMNMLQLHHMHPTIHQPPTSTLYNAWLYSCFLCSSETDDALYTAEAILRNLERNLENGTDAEISHSNTSSFEILPPPASVPKPTKGMYNHVLLIHANRAKTMYGAAVQAEDLVMRMSKVGVHPTTDTFNRVLKAWADCPEKEGGNRAADVLHLMLSLSDVASNLAHGNEIAPDEISFGTVIGAFLKRSTPEACQLILEEAVTYFASDEQRSSQIPSLNQCWNNALFGWAKSGRPDAPERVEALLNDGILVNDQQYKVVPTKTTYVACMEAHLKSGRPDRIEKAERYIHVMVELMRGAKVAPGNVKEDFAVTTREFNTLINAWFRALQELENIGIRKDAGMHPIGYTSTKASSLLFQMLKLHEEGYRTCAPSSGSFHMCIESLCRTAAACLTAAKRVKKVIGKTKKAKVTDESCQLAPEYKTSMAQYAKLAADEALKILEMAENRRLSEDSSYAVVIQLLCRLRDPVYTFKATEVLRRYEKCTDEGDLKWQEKTVWIYHTIVTALNAVRTMRAAESALEILRRIPKEGKRAIDKNGIWVYTGVLCAFALHPGERSCAVAMELFKELISAPNDNVQLNNSINVDFCERVLWILADSRSKQSAGYACEVLNSILGLHSAKKISLEPSTSCFDACIHTLTAVRDLEYTTYSVQLLKVIVSNYENKIFSHLPSKSSFDLIIRSCIEVGSGEMLQHANEVTLLAEKYLNTDNQHQNVTS